MLLNFIGLFVLLFAIAFDCFAHFSATKERKNKNKLHFYPIWGRVKHSPFEISVELHGQHELIEHKLLTVECQLVLHTILCFHIIIGFSELLWPCWRFRGVLWMARSTRCGRVTIQFVFTFLASLLLLFVFTHFLFDHFSFVFHLFEWIIWLGHFRMATTHINCTKSQKLNQSLHFCTLHLLTRAQTAIVSSAAPSFQCANASNVIFSKRFPIRDVRTSQHSASNYWLRFDFSISTSNGMCLLCTLVQCVRARR